MRGHLIAVPLLLLAAAHAQNVTQRQVDAPKNKPLPYRVWPSAPPRGCPFERSRSILGVGFTGRHAEYENADTWYPTWAADGNLYSPFTDGRVNGLESVSFGENATTGYAKIVGDDPLKLQVMDAGMYRSNPAPYGGRYPCGSLVYNGIWYYGTYCLMDEDGSNEPVVRVDNVNYNWSVLGPFVGFRHSIDFGKTWVQTKHTPASPLFPEPKKRGDPVRIGSPHFVDFGKNMEHSPDGKAYLVAHGAAVPDQMPRRGNASWITGDCVYLLRVTPTPENIEDASKFEFYAGNDRSGKPVWTNDFGRIKPLVEWNNHMGCVTMTYDAPLKKYLMCVTDGGTTMSTYNTYILESDRITGPFRLATHMRRFGQQAYFVNIPSKFISKDGRTAWLCYAANFGAGWLESLVADPPGSRYGMCLQEIRLIGLTDPMPSGPLNERDNIAPLATVTVSSTYNGYSPKGAVDGVVAGFPGDTSHEWASLAEGDTAFLRLTWDEDYTVDQVWLFDRPNSMDQVTSGMLVFSDGSTIKTGALPDDAKQGLEVRFPARKVRWLAFIVTGVKVGSPNIGLSEIAVFKR